MNIRPFALIATLLLPLYFSRDPIYKRTRISPRTFWICVSCLLLIGILWVLYWKFSPDSE
jgi:hypothetical protein